MRYRHVVGVLCTLALACAGIAASAAPGGAAAPSEEFTENGTYYVPNNVCQIDILAYGGSGGPRLLSGYAKGGDGGGVIATFEVQPGDDLNVYVGKHGTPSNGDGGPGGQVWPGGDGYNQGGDGHGAGAGGGGSSAVVNDGNLLIVAGGGGGGRTTDGDPDRIGGDGGQGVSNGSPGTGAGGGAGGALGTATSGGDAPNVGSTSNGGGGAGAEGGSAGSGSPSPAGGAGGGGASNTFGALDNQPAPGNYPSGGGDAGTNGSVIIRPAEYGEGCVTATLQVRKKVGTNPVTNPVPPSGYVVRVDCSDDPGDPTYLPFLSNGSPDSSNAPWGWYPVDGTWLHEFRSVYGVRCTATETDTGDATLVQYACDWNPGHQKFSPAALDIPYEELGCPGFTNQPGEDPNVSGTVLLEGCGDFGLLTVYNDFPEEPVTPDVPDTPSDEGTVTPPAAGPAAAAPAAIVAQARFTG